MRPAPEPPLGHATMQSGTAPLRRTARGRAARTGAHHRHNAPAENVHRPPCGRLGSWPGLHPQPDCAQVTRNTARSQRLQQRRRRVPTRRHEMSVGNREKRDVKSFWGCDFKSAPWFPIAAAPHRSVARRRGSVLGPLHMRSPLLALPHRPPEVAWDVTTAGPTRPRS
jgi:hypothetical protein